MQAFDDADGRHHLRGERAAGDLDGLGPGPVVEARLVPAVDEDAGVIALAVVEAVFLERAVRCPPALVGKEDLPLAAFVLDLDAAGELGPVVAVALDVAAVAEDDADRVPVADEPGHVVGGIEGFLPVIRPAGIEDARPDLFPVQAELVMAETGDEDHGQSGPVFEPEFTAEVDRAGLRVVGAGVAEKDGALGPKLASRGGGRSIWRSIRRDSESPSQRRPSRSRD